MEIRLTSTVSDNKDDETRMGPLRDRLQEENEYCRSGGCEKTGETNGRSITYE